MTGILAESLLLQLFVNLFGRNLTGYFLGGIFSLSSALLHKVISLLILYGFDIFKIYLNLYYYAAKQVRIENADPWILILILAGSYLLFGMIAALLGYVIGNKSLRMASSGPFIPDILEASSGNPESKPEKSYSLLMLAIHVVALPVSLFLINRSGSPVEFLFPGSYFLFMLVMYRNYLGKLKKPFFWLQLMMVTVLATFFWSGATGIPSLTQWQGFYVGLQLNFRALIVVTGFAAISMELKNPVIKQYLVDHGFRSIYLSVDLAFSILPFMMKKGPRGRSFFIHPLSSLSSSLSQADQWIEYLRTKP
jgi:hypothetical protein